MIGSGRANRWWKYNSDCTLYDEAYKCKLAAGDSAASILVHHNPTLEAHIGNDMCQNPNRGTQPCPVVGQASHFGSKNESDGYNIAVNAKITGPIIASSGGWFLRFSAGTPNPVSITNVQFQVPDDKLLVALPYPSGTTFNISYRGPSWCSTYYYVCTHYLRPVTSVSAVLASYGDAYYWNNAARTLYLRPVMADSQFGLKPDILQWSALPSITRNFSRGGQTIYSPSSSASIVITASCNSNPCAAQNDVSIPAAIYIGPPTTTSGGATVGYNGGAAGGANGGANGGATTMNNGGSTTTQPGSTGGVNSAGTTGPSEVHSSDAGQVLTFLLSPPSPLFLSPPFPSPLSPSPLSLHLCLFLIMY